MTPGARVATAIELLDLIFGGRPAEAALTGWARRNRYAGSKDRAAIRDLVFDALRCRASSAVLGGARTGRGVILGLLRQRGVDPAALMTGEGHAPPAPSAAERDILAGPVDMSDPDRLDIPGWLWPVWQADLGDRAGEIAGVLRARAPVGLRVNIARTDRASAISALAGAGIEAVPHPSPAPEFATALIVGAGARGIRDTAPFRQGLVELQDAASQAVCALVPAKCGARVLDFCAGGGGKALALAARGARVTCHDANPDRMRDLPERARRAGVRIDRAAPGALGACAPFDTVLVDVPCSGSGTWRRAPDAKWRLRRGDLDALESLQRKIVKTAAELVGASGYLAYATCSVLRRENEAMAAWIGNTTGFAPCLERRFLPDACGDGLYCAIFARNRAP